jgi:hypothetical protein
MGIYRWPDIIRLPAFGKNGTRLSDDTIILGEIAIR